MLVSKLLRPLESHMRVSVCFTALRRNGNSCYLSFIMSGFHQLKWINWYYLFPASKEEICNSVQRSYSCIRLKIGALVTPDNMSELPSLKESDFNKRHLFLAGSYGNLLNSHKLVTLEWTAYTKPLPSLLHFPRLIKRLPRCNTGRPRNGRNVCSMALPGGAGKHQPIPGRAFSLFRQRRPSGTGIGNEMHLFAARMQCSN